MGPNQRLEELRTERGIVFREGLLCVAIRRQLLINLLFFGDPAEWLFEPTVLYKSSDEELCLSGFRIADAERLFRTLLVSTITRVTATAKTFVVNPVVDRFDPSYARGIICLAAPTISNKSRD